MAEHMLGTSSAYPVDRANHVVAPEYFQTTTLESLSPDQIAYVDPSALAVDQTTRGIYVSASGYLIGDNDLRPSIGELDRRAGIMRCEQLLPGGREVGCAYVADLRRLKPNDFAKFDITQPEDHFNPEYQRRENIKRGWIVLAAAMLLDPDEVPQFLGDERYRDQVEYVVLQAETRRQNLSFQANIDRAKVQNSYVPRHGNTDTNAAQ